MGGEVRDLQAALSLTGILMIVMITMVFMPFAIPLVQAITILSHDITTDVSEAEDADQGGWWLWKWSIRTYVKTIGYKLYGTSGYYKSEHYGEIKADTEHNTKIECQGRLKLAAYSFEGYLINVDFIPYSFTIEGGEDEDFCYRDVWYYERKGYRYEAYRVETDAMWYYKVYKWEFGRWKKIKEDWLRANAVCTYQGYG